MTMMDEDRIFRIKKTEEMYRRHIAEEKFVSDLLNIENKEFRNILFETIAEVNEVLDHAKKRLEISGLEVLK